MRAINTVVERDIQEIIGDSHIFKAFQDKTILVTGATGLIGSMVKPIIFHYMSYAMCAI